MSELMIQNTLSISINIIKISDWNFKDMITEISLIEPTTSHGWFHTVEGIVLNYPYLPLARAVIAWCQVGQTTNYN